MEERLVELQNAALNNSDMRVEFLKTRESIDPLRAFCEKCGEYGIDITIGELIGMGDSFCDSMIRSVNGGGVDAPLGDWNDFYELFMSALEMKE